MSVIDILFRVDDICRKYDKYDIEKQRDLNATGDDAFAQLYAALESEVDKALLKFETASAETNRAAAVAMNAEVRRTKARVKQEFPKLQKLAVKKVKGISKEEQETRKELVFVLANRIEAIPDATTTAAKSNGGWETSASHKNIKFDSSGEQGLDVISEGLDTLKSLAQDMNEELDRQVPLMDEIDTKVDRATSDLKNNNVRLKETLFKMRSSRNFCIDIILMCVILGIACYLYSVLK
ncbi:hypothetical protein LWI28_027616 [Acer negundo]|uniref:t-SNARE coiled-coil homology domain-containing protein n=1 Tax=Acer negundo TaxID=4023 RepID=A0AAD5JEU5_ACENE|nr:hypothetical protein LWI28_011548 [Acer negundo]KAI9196863.1 hypothetical protein LWI28_027616 [Acer negundo]